MSSVDETNPAVGRAHAMINPHVTKAPRSKAMAFVALTKPRIIELLLVTTVPTMFVAQRGVPDLWLMVATVIGGALAAGGANAANMWWDRDIDAVMNRTKRRPLVTGEVSPGEALVFSLALLAASFAWLTGFVNLLSAVLALSAAAFYVFVYTIWLKRNYSSNIVIGGAAGGVPVLVGWAAVTNTVELAPLMMFAIIFVWTPPHFWALAFKYRNDYQDADVPMLPAVSSLAYTAKQIVAYTIAMVVLSFALAPIADLGAVYWAIALATGATFTWFAAKLFRDKDEKSAMRLFHWSITYITLLFGGMALDQLINIG